MSAISPSALVVCYLGFTGILVLMALPRLYAGGVIAHFGVLVAVAAATWMPGVPRWLRAWAPLLTILFLSAEMPLLIRAAGHPEMRDGVVIAWEATLFGMQPAAAWAGRHPSIVLSELLHLAYLSYYPLIFIVPAVLWFRDRPREFTDAVFALMLTFVLCFSVYLFFPVAGPRYLWLSPIGALDGPARGVATWLLGAHSSMGTAFPSSHVAVATTAAILATRYFGSWGFIAAIVAAGLGVGAVYGGFHYLVDVLAGVVTGLVSVTLARLFPRLLPVGPQANASAPTYPDSSGALS
jgi:membrane-associated phospholipid phosphatase